MSSYLEIPISLKSGARAPLNPRPMYFVVSRTLYNSAICDRLTSSICIPVFEFSDASNKSFSLVFFLFSCRNITIYKYAMQL
jgi:hypothetical protein